MQCPACGQELPLDAVKCPYCGFRVKSARQEEPVAVPSIILVALQLIVRPICHESALPFITDALPQHFQLAAGLHCKPPLYQTLTQHNPR